MRERVLEDNEEVTLTLVNSFKKTEKIYFYQKDQSQNFICDGLMYNILFVDPHNALFTFPMPEDTQHCR